MESLCKLIQKAKETNTGWDLLLKQLQPLIRGYAKSTISSSLLKVVLLAATRPPLSAHGRYLTFPTETFKLIFLKKTLYPISSRN